MGNFAPAPVAQLYDAFMAGDSKRAQVLHYDLHSLVDAAFAETNPVPAKWVMKQLGLHEGCIEQIDRLFRTRLGKGVEVDEAQRIRVDDWELSPEVQAEVSRRWPLLSTETLGELADLPEYRSQFLRLFGFGIDGVDYSQDVDPRVVTD